MRLVLLLPLLLLMTGCCVDSDDTYADDCECGWSDCEEDEPEPSHVRINNLTDQAVIVRYVSAGGVDYRTTIAVGGHLDYKAWPHNDAIKADYNHIIHWYDIPDQGAVTIDIEADDFVPATPVANG